MLKNRRSIRLPQYDYSEPGAYFVTINSFQRRNIFGRLANGTVHLNKFGTLAAKCWFEIPKHFQNVVVDTFIVMPNHVHAILMIEDNVRATHASPLQRHGVARGPARSSLGAIVGSYKSAVSRAINELRATRGAGVWQRNYYERVLRDDVELNAAREYVLNNAIDSKGPGWMAAS